MQREILSFDNEADWLRAREQDVTSTEVSALFGCSPYATEYELFHRKTGVLPDSFEDNDRTRWGRRLEGAIAEGMAEDLGLIVEPFKTYIRIPDLRIGSSFDFKIVGLRDGWSGSDDTYRRLFEQHGPGVMEIKNVDGLAFRRGWIDGEELEAPPHIELQAQHQLEVSEFGWVVIAPLINGNTPRPSFRLRDAAIGEAIREKVAQFWQRIADNNPPEPDFAADAEAVARMYMNNNGESADMSGDNYLAGLCAEYAEAGETKSQAEKRRDALKAEILTIIGEYAKVTASGFKISAGTVEDSPGKIVTPDMVGTYVGGRRGYRNLRISPAK